MAALAELADLAGLEDLAGSGSFLVSSILTGPVNSQSGTEVAIEKLAKYKRKPRSQTYFFFIHSVN